MKLRFNRLEMADVLTTACSVAASRSPKEVLKCIHIDVKPDVALLSATDLELSFRGAITQVEVDDPGETLVVAETFGKIVRECTDEVLAIETAGSILHVRGSGSHFQIVTQDTADFPAIPDMEGTEEIAITFGQLRRMIELTVFSAARESTRYAINGVLWEVVKNRLTLAATDGRRLSVAHGDLLGDCGKDPGPRAIVPAKTLSLFARLTAEDDARVSMRFSSNQLVLEVGQTMLSTSLVEGQFPKYQDVVPSDCDRIVEMETGEFLGALRRASLLTNEESAGVRFAFSEGNMTLTARAPQQGEAEVAIPVGFTGENLDIGFNPVYLIEMLRVAHADRVTFALKEANRPGVIRLGDDFVYVVMPVNLTSA